MAPSTVEVKVGIIQDFRGRKIVDFLLENSERKEQCRLKLSKAKLSEKSKGTVKEKKEQCRLKLSKTKFSEKSKGTLKGKVIRGIFRIFLFNRGSTSDNGTIHKEIKIGASRDKKMMDFLSVVLGKKEQSAKSKGTG
ncbi:hypothetical protein K0M31_019543 [Melipona bicolor]|uniref:Uncharacterized protein n=1 Tax=Melipona bicolor TaxID=60889 RepID=A0AA40G2K5_9HYME|nr:hypothetical protein K0M31_019543 [Melipona bicolor]